MDHFGGSGPFDDKLRYLLILIANTIPLIRIQLLSTNDDAIQSSALRKLTMIEGTRNEISRALSVQILSSQVLLSLRLSDLMIEVDFENLENTRIINSMFKARDIYNITSHIEDAPSDDDSSTTAPNASSTGQPTATRIIRRQESRLGVQDGDRSAGCPRPELANQLPERKGSQTG